MSDQLISMSAVITLPSGSPASIDLHDRTNFQLVEWNPPGISYRLTEVTGEYQPGSVLVNAVRDTATLSGTVRVFGTSEATLRTNIALLFRALGQFSYSLTETIESNVTVYTRCRPANIAPVGGVDDVTRALRQADFTFTIRCHPATVEAP